MIASTLLTLFGLFTIFASLVLVALLTKIWDNKSEEFSELRRIQGSYKNMFSGQLDNPPSEFGDFRIMRGLKWDKKQKRYVTQSALSSEALRSAFPN